CIRPTLDLNRSLGAKLEIHQRARGPSVSKRELTVILSIVRGDFDDTLYRLGHAVLLCLVPVMHPTTVFASVRPTKRRGSGVFVRQGRRWMTTWTWPEARKQDP